MNEEHDRIEEYRDIIHIKNWQVFTWLQMEVGLNLSTTKGVSGKGENKGL